MAGDLEREAPGFGRLYVPLPTWGWFALLIFSAMWLLCFVRHVQHCAIAGSLASWYAPHHQSPLAMGTSRRGGPV